MDEKSCHFYQLFEKETSSFTYLLGDPESAEALIIDPVLEMVQRDLQFLKELGLKLKYVLDTHVHADHITGSGELAAKTGAKIAIGASYKVGCAQIQVQDGQELEFGSFKVKAISTPGHTNGCVSYLWGSKVFTGDALLIRGCGRTDFQSGSAKQLFESVREKLFSLPGATEVYPGHDYNGFNKSSIELEKKFNPRLNLSVTADEFLKTMENLNLPHPKKIKKALPANLNCGLP